MSDPIPLPSVQFSVADRGGEYLVKLQALAHAIDSAISAFNLSVAAGTEATQTLEQIIATQQSFDNASAQLLQDIDEAGTQLLQAAMAIRDETQAISASGLPPTDGQLAKVLTVTESGLAWRSIEQEVPSSDEQLNKVLTVTSSGLAWQQLNRLMVITEASTAQPDFRHLFMSTVDLQLPLAPDNSRLVCRVDYSVDLNNGKCRLLPPEGETIHTPSGGATSINLIESRRDFGFIRINGQWRAE